MQGGSILFNMGATPNKQRGTNPLLSFFPSSTKKGTALKKAVPFCMLGMSIV